MNLLRVSTLMITLLLLTGCGTILSMSDNSVQRERLRTDAQIETAQARALAQTEAANARAQAQMAVQEAKSRAEIAIAQESTQRTRATENGQTDRFMALQMTTVASMQQTTQITYIILFAFFALLLFGGVAFAAILFWGPRETRVATPEIEYLPSYSVGLFLGDYDKFREAGWRLLPKNNEGDRYARKIHPSGKISMFRLLEDKQDAIDI